MGSSFKRQSQTLIENKVFFKGERKMVEWCKKLRNSILHAHGALKSEQSAIFNELSVWKEASEELREEIKTPK